MKADFYRLYCVECKKFHTIEEKDVNTILDLEIDRVIFKSKCPVCKKEILSTRLLFNR